MEHYVGLDVSLKQTSICVVKPGWINRARGRSRFGQKKAVAIAVRNVSGRRRWSKLQEWLRPNPSLSRQIGVAS